LGRNSSEILAIKTAEEAQSTRNHWPEGDLQWNRSEIQSERPTQPILKSNFLYIS